MVFFFQSMIQIIKINMLYDFNKMNIFKCDISLCTLIILFLFKFEFVKHSAKKNQLTFVLLFINNYNNQYSIKK